MNDGVFIIWANALKYYRSLTGRAIIRPVPGGYKVLDGRDIDRQIVPPKTIIRAK